MLSPVTTAVRTAVVGVGAAVVVLAYRAARRTDSTALRGLTVGLAAVAAGGALGGGVDSLVGLDVRTGTLLGGLLTLVGFGVLLWTLYLEEPSASPVHS